jgi:VanZ family protein
VLKRSKILILAAAGWTLFIPLLSLLPPSFFKAAGSMGRVPGMDKLIHAFLYGVQTILLIAAWRTRNRPVGRAFLMNVALASGAYGLLMEVLQRVLTDCREFSWGDVAANLAGTFAAAALMSRVFKKRPA